MPQPTDLHHIIRALESNLDKLNDPSRQFVQDMAARLDKEKDNFYCSPKQVKYLRSLAAQLGLYKNTSDKPLSKLQELKERRATLINRIYKDKKAQHKADLLTVTGVSEMRRHDIRATNARMRHAKSYERAWAMANAKPEAQD